MNSFLEFAIFKKELLFTPSAPILVEIVKIFALTVSIVLILIPAPLMAQEKF